MHRFFFVICCVLVIAGNHGCSPAPQGAAKTYPIKGTVNLDGKPMPDGEIAFSVPGEMPNIIPIADGAFSGQAHVGKNLVEVRAFKQGPPLSTDPNGPPTKLNTIPNQFNGPESTLKADVSAGGSNDFKFDVTSR